MGAEKLNLDGVVGDKEGIEFDPVAGPVAAALGVASILFYVFVYTVWLKPRSAWKSTIR